MLDFDDGVHWIGTEIFVDARRAKDRAIVTHAHSDHVARHKRWVASPPTAALCARRWGAADVEIHPFHEPWDEGGARVTLLPAGHILGSSMVLVERGGTRVLYSGDFRLKPSATAERCAPEPADVLVMECTYGDPRYRFPDRTGVLDQLCEWITRVRRQGGTPVLLAYSLGKAQEVARLLAERGVPVWLHEDAHAMMEIYASFGVAFPDCRRYEGGTPGEGALLFPPGPRSRRALWEVRRRRTAFLSGWALDPWRTRMVGDAAFAISDHGDFDELLELVALVKPRKVYTLHGPDRFAARLRALGHDAEPASLAAQGSLF